MSGITATDVVSGNDVAQILEERTQHTRQFRRAYRDHDATGIDSGQFTFPEAQDRARGQMDEVAEEADYPRTTLEYDGIVAEYVKDGFEILVTDETVSDSTFDVIMDVTEEMGQAAETRLDNLAYTVIDNNNAGENIGGGSGDIDYEAIVDAWVALFDNEGRTGQAELYISGNGFGSLAKDNNFTRASEAGDAVVMEGELTQAYGISVLPTNTGDLGNDEAFLVDTSLYGYESRRWNRDVTTYREESKDADVYKIRHRMDYVSMNDDLAVDITGGTG